MKRRTKPLSKHVKERASKARPMSYAEILTERYGRLIFPTHLSGARINSLQVAEETIRASVPSFDTRADGDRSEGQILAF